MVDVVQLLMFFLYSCLKPSEEQVINQTKTPAGFRWVYITLLTGARHMNLWFGKIRENSDAPQPTTLSVRPFVSASPAFVSKYHC